LQQRPFCNRGKDQFSRIENEGISKFEKIKGIKMTKNEIAKSPKSKKGKIQKGFFQVFETFKILDLKVSNFAESKTQRGLGRSTSKSETGAKHVNFVYGAGAKSPCLHPPSNLKIHTIKTQLQKHITNCYLEITKKYSHRYSDESPPY